MKQKVENYRYDVKQVPIEVGQYVQYVLRMKGFTGGDSPTQTPNVNRVEVQNTGYTF